MSIQTKSFGYKNVDKLLHSQESHFRDFKSSKTEPAKLTKILSAFANADGGEVFIGIREDKQKGRFVWEGFHRQEDANGLIQICEKLFPLGREFCYEFLLFNRSYVLHIEIHKTRDIKTASDQKVYLRRGAQNLPQATEEELDRLRRNKGLSSFEDKTVAVPPFSIIDSKETVSFLSEVAPTASNAEVWLTGQLLVQDKKPTVCGILLFAEEPQAILPKRCGIKIYRYKTKEAIGSRETLAFDPITIEGCVYKQIYGAVAKTVEIVESVPSGRFDKVTYPGETLHEIITNAVLHRDYSIPRDVHIRIFDNRVEVESPGILPGHITVKNILSEQFSRNPRLVRLINRFPSPPNKDVGEGLNTAFQAMKRLKLKEPVITQLEAAVLVTIPHEPLDEPAAIILKYLLGDTERSITAPEARQLCHLSSVDQARTILKCFALQNRIQQTGQKRKNAYIYCLSPQATEISRSENLEISCP